MPTLSVAMNIGALFGLTTSTPGSAPKLGAPGFEALLAGLISGMSSPPVEGAFVVPSGGPPGEWPPPPPPPLEGLGVEELKTSEPNAPSKKPDLPAPTEAQPIPSLGLVSMVMPVLPSENPQVEAFLQSPPTGLGTANLTDRPLAFMADGQTQPESASTDPQEAAFSKLLDSTELNVKMVRIDVPTVDGSPARPTTSATLDLTAFRTTAPAVAVAVDMRTDTTQSVSTTGDAKTQGVPVEATWPKLEAPQVLPLAPEVARQVEHSGTQTPTVATPASVAGVHAVPEQPVVSPRASHPAEPVLADAKPAAAQLEPVASKSSVGKSREPEIEQPQDSIPTGRTIEPQAQNATMSDSGTEKDQRDEEATDDANAPKLETGRPQPEVASNRSGQTASRPNPVEPPAGTRSQSRANQVHADRIEAFAATHPRGTITIDMDPLDLGKIQLVVKQSEGSIEAHVVAQDERVRQALQASQAHLVQSFENRGVRLEQFHVSALSSSTTAEFGHEHRQPSQPTHQALQHGRPTQQASSRPVLVASAHGGVDLTI